jgi:hypothetical protein
MHLAYMFWFIAPAYRQAGFGISWLDGAAWAAIGGWWLGAYLWALRRPPGAAVAEARYAAT